MGTFAFEYFAKITGLLKEIDLSAVDECMAIVEDAWKREAQVFIIGNGGSASTASHYACDLNKGTARPDCPRLRVMSLTDNFALFSAIANDYGYEHVFTEQLKHFFKPNDVLIGISASGNSPNVVNAFDYVREAKGKTVAIVGFSGGKLREMADCVVHIPSDEYGPVEDVQLLINHLMTDYFRRVLMPDFLVQQATSD